MKRFVILCFSLRAARPRGRVVRVFARQGQKRPHPGLNPVDKLAAAFRAVRGGALVAITSPPDEALAKAHNVRATFVYHQAEAGRLGLIVGLLDASRLEVLTDLRAPLDGFRPAFERQGSGRARGKIIIKMPSPSSTAAASAGAAATRRRGGPVISEAEK